MRNENKLDLTSTEEKFDHIFNNLLIGIAFLSHEGFFLKANQKFCDLLEFPEDELKKKHWKDITHPDDLEKSSNYVKLNENREMYKCILEKRYVTGTNKIISCRITTSVIRNEDKSVKLFVTQIEDITSNKKLVKAIQKGRELLKEAILKHS
jgi:diguanylate cyclase